MINEINELTKFLSYISIGSFSIVGLIGFLSKTLLKKIIDKDLINYKNKLLTLHEAYKLDLKKNEFEHQTRFKNVYIDLYKVIKNIHKDLILYKILVEDLIDSIENDNLNKVDEKIDSWVEICDRIEPCFFENTILFSSDSFMKISNFFYEYRYLNKKFADYIENQQNYDSIRRSKFIELVKKHKVEILEPIIFDLTNSFQRIINLELI